MIMKQRWFRFDSPWAIASIVIGIVATLSSSVGAGRPIDFQFLAAGGFMGFSIYMANIWLHNLFGWRTDQLSSSPLRIGGRVLVSALGGVVGWTVGYMILILAATGRFGLPSTSGPMRWLLLVTIVITILVGLIAHGYYQLRTSLEASIAKLKEREYAEKELEVARSIQARLLPPPLIEGDGFVITARNLPAHFVAGDFYDVLRHEDGSVGIVIADVSGKGIGASLIMASVKAVLPFVANGAVDETLRTLNHQLIGQLGPREFVALAYARFHPATGKLRIANAGMPDPYLLADGSATPIVVTGERLPLGVRDDITYDSIEVQLGPHDRLLLVSDGIPEAPQANGDPFGYDALRATLAGMPPADGWIDTLLERERGKVSAIDDDWTAVLLERR
jgi:hypothetical protein